MHFLLYLYSRKTSIWPNVILLNIQIIYYIYYIKNKRHEREANIINDKWNEINIEQDSLFHDLLKGMLNENPEDRPNLEKILYHPYFWNDEEKLIFICDLSDFLEAHGSLYYKIC